MYKASTYFTTLFSKLSVTDKEMRKCISDLYGELIETALKDVPESRRIPVLKFISLTIKDTIIYLKSFENQKKDIDPQTLRALQSVVNLCNNMITRIGLRTSSYEADKILNEAFLSDTVCDIGECSKEFKRTNSLRERIIILRRLKMLLSNYNSVLHTDLTVRDVLKGSK